MPDPTDVARIAAGELLPCPRCGGTATVWNAFPQFEEGWCIAFDHGPECHDRGWEGYCYATEADAVAACNVRHHLGEKP